MKQKSHSQLAYRVSGTLRGLVVPAFWIVVAAEQWGPDYEPMGWGRIIDVAIRWVVSLIAACLAVKAIRDNNTGHLRRDSGRDVK